MPSLNLVSLVFLLLNNAIYTTLGGVRLTSKEMVLDKRWVVGAVICCLMLV